tara:strand:- start:1336 stop:1536 length:201 start_codon:yes stop_codon:yes gene_type:complete
VFGSLGIKMNKQELINEIEHQLNEMLEINIEDIEAYGNNGLTLKKIEAMKNYSKKLFEFARNNKIK